MNYDNLIFGEDVIYTANCNSTGLNNNIIVCGGSGSGKTVSILEPLLLETKHSSLITTVTKRRVVNEYKPLFISRGYIVDDLNFINPNDSTVCFDPLAYIKRYEDITFLAEAIVNANPKKENTTADPYWDAAAVSLLAAEIAYIMMSKKEAKFSDVLLFHDSLNINCEDSLVHTSLDRTFNELAKKKPNCFAIRCWRTFKCTPSTTASCIFSVLNTCLDTLFTPEIRKMISSKKSIDIKSLANNKTVLFITSSAVNPSVNYYINIMYSLIIKELFEIAEEESNGHLPVPVRLICDDFATGGCIQNFPEYVSIFREKQISATILIQSESQLDNLYGPSNSTTIINNCDTYIYMGGMDLKTSKSVSERLNVPVDEVLFMPIGKEYVFRRGQKPISTRRYNTYDHPIYREYIVSEKNKNHQQRKERA